MSCHESVLCIHCPLSGGVAYVLVRLWQSVSRHGDELTSNDLKGKERRMKIESRRTVKEFKQATVLSTEKVGDAPLHQQ
jgi:hypothetical protein